MDASIPNWIQVGSKCRWWSESQQTHHEVVITSVDVVRRRVVAHFAADSSVWKNVPFSLIHANGPLLPNEPDASFGEPKRKSQSAQMSQERAEGTATPPWYEKLNDAENRQEVKQEIRRKEENHGAVQERRRYLWQQEKQRKVEEERRQREEERQAREAEAERARLRIVQKLQREREEENLRKFEVLLMGKEDEVSKRANSMWRQREEVARRQQEEEERERFEEEQRRADQKLQEERAARPRIAFGVARHEPKAWTSPPPSKASAAPPIVRLERKRHSWDSREASSLPAQPADHVAPETAIAPSSHLAQRVPGPREPAPAKSHLASTLANLRPNLSAEQWYGLQIRAVYQQHNPEKLADVPHLMEKYSGSEEEMYDRICEKLRPRLECARIGRAGNLWLRCLAMQKKQDSHSMPDNAPSASSLLARFQSLVGDAMDPVDEEATDKELFPRGQQHFGRTWREGVTEKICPNSHWSTDAIDRFPVHGARAGSSVGDGVVCPPSSIERNRKGVPIGARLRGTSQDPSGTEPVFRERCVRSRSSPTAKIQLFRVAVNSFECASADREPVSMTLKEPKFQPA
ncbi:unnamed protein product [Symbiodinium sp. CCMP2456]|nr:unnamed protein product [Symbiodinium sp. CCMP2456]